MDNVRTLACLVVDRNGRGEVIDVFSTFEEALLEAKKLNEPYRIYLKNFEENSEAIVKHTFY